VLCPRTQQANLPACSPNDSFLMFNVKPVKTNF